MTVLASLLILQQPTGDVFKGFSADPSEKTYQDMRWLKQPIAETPPEMNSFYRSQGVSWTGHKYDRTRLKPFEANFKNGKSYNDVFRFGVAFLGHNGTLSSEPAFYIANNGTARKECYSVYWAISKLWPKNPTWLDFRVRVQYYTLCGGVNQNLLAAVKRYRTKFPLDATFKRLEVGCEMTVRKLWGTKMSVEELQKGYDTVKKLAKENKGMSFQAAHAMMAAELAEVTGKQQYIDEYLKISKRQIVEMKKYPQDAIAIPQLEKEMERISKIGK